MLDIFATVGVEVERNDACAEVQERLIACPLTNSHRTTSSKAYVASIDYISELTELVEHDGCGMSVILYSPPRSSLASIRGTDLRGDLACIRTLQPPQRR